MRPLGVRQQMGRWCWERVSIAKPPGICSPGRHLLGGWPQPRSLWDWQSRRTGRWRIIVIVARCRAASPVYPSKRPEYDINPDHRATIEPTQGRRTRDCSRIRSPVSEQRPLRLRAQPPIIQDVFRMEQQRLQPDSTYRFSFRNVCKFLHGSSPQSHAAPHGRGS